MEVEDDGFFGTSSSETPVVVLPVIRCNGNGVPRLMEMGCLLRRGFWAQRETVSVGLSLSSIRAHDFQRCSCMYSQLTPVYIDAFNAHLLKLASIPCEIPLGNVFKAVSKCLKAGSMHSPH